MPINIFSERSIVQKIYKLSKITLFQRKLTQAMSSYKAIKIDVSPAKARKIAAGKSVNLTAAEVRGEDETLHVHPMNYEKLMKAKRANKGTRLQLTQGEIEHDIMAGGNVFKWLGKAAKSVYKFGKDNWNIVKPIVSKVADVAVPALATFVGQPALGATGREALRSLTGVGVHAKLGKGTPEMAARMARLRSMRKGGSMRAGSFKL